MAKTQKVKLNYPKIIAALLIVIIIAGIGVIAVSKMVGNENNNPVGNSTVVSSSKEIYSIRSNATEYQKEVYEELKEALKSEDQQLIAEALVKNFVADFYTLSNKSIKNDVGGTQFWSTDARLTLRTKAIDTFYTNLELYVRDYGNENLPCIENVTITGSSLMDGDHIYAISAEWTYVENSVFDTSDFQNSAMFEVTNETGTSYIYKFY